MDVVTSVIFCSFGLFVIFCAKSLMKQSNLEWIAKWCNRGFLAVLKYLFSYLLLILLAVYVAIRQPDVVWAIHVMRDNITYQAFFVYFGVLVPVGILLVGFTAGIGMVLLGRTLSSFMRENVTDVIALIYTSAALCLSLSVVAFYGPLLLYNNSIHLHIYFWLVWSTSLACIWLRPSDKLHITNIWRYVINIVFIVAPYIFLSGVLILVSYGISRWMFRIEEWQNISMYFKQCEDTLVGSSIWLCAFVLIAAALFSARAGVNSSSMHRYYLARLAETFLGEPPNGAPKKFKAYLSSGFNPKQLKLHRLRPSEGYFGPILLLNCCLNAKRREDPRARLGENFVFSPRGCGFFPSDNSKNSGVFQDPGKYFYAREKGISLASCMAISGSALGSSMGYLSSFRTRLFHTAFNFRLGWWFCNPSYPNAWNGNLPRSRISCHMKEIFGKMTDQNAFVYLSDGGHFDNLGAYELLRRRCHVIIISDASRDNHRTCKALTYAVSKARIDLNVSVEFDEDQNVYQSIAPAGRIAVGKIHYTDPDQQDGIIIYIKPEVLGNEPMDVVGYARTHPTFPHDPTSSQWFSEAQFEAYRKLGELSGEDAAEVYRRVTAE